MKLKLCGIRNTEMLQFCEEAGVRYAGVNFVSWSKRKVSLEKAIALLSSKKGKTKRIAVFMNQSFEEISNVLRKVEFDGVQLHGKENARLLQKLKESFGKLELWKTFLIEKDFNKTLLQQYCNSADKFLFDGKIPGSGKTIIDTEKLHEVIKEAERLNMPYGIAGGINADNIAKFKVSFPNAKFLDTASGIEKNGKFDVAIAKKLIEMFKK